MEVFATECDLPYIYVDSETVAFAGLLERHRATVLELNDLISGYLRRRDEAGMHLTQLRALLQLQASGPDGGAAVGRSGNQESFSQLGIGIAMYIIL